MCTKRTKKTVAKKTEEAPKVVVEKVEPVLVQASNAEQMTESSESNDSSVTEILNCLIQEIICFGVHINHF